MANHPYNQHREQQVAHRRVATILTDSPSSAQKHNQGAAFSKITSKSAAVRDDDVRGHSAPKRYARGGKVHKGKGDTNIAIVLPGGGKPPMAGGPPMGAPPGLPPGGPPMPPPPMGGPPGMPPGGPPPGMPMRASGGRIGGEGTKANDKKWANRAKDNSYFRGGAATGVGREEKAANAKRK